MSNLMYECRFEYGTVLTAEQWRLLQEEFSFSHDAEEQEDGTFKLSSWWSFTATPEHVKRAFPDMTIIIGKPVPAEHAYVISEAVSKMRAQLNRLESKIGTPGLPNYAKYSELTEPKQANPEPYFMMIKEVTVEEDACTNTINSLLRDDTWHILAIIPQSGQRRPDYILGKL